MAVSHLRTGFEYCIILNCSSLPHAGPIVQREEVLRVVRSYELMVIIDATVEDHSVEVKAVEEIIAKVGGEVTKTDVWGKRRFAYEINKQTEGIYVVYEFKGDPSQLAELNRVLGLRPTVLRHLNVAVDE